MGLRKCVLVILPFICVSLAVPLMNDDDVPDLAWPEKYTIEIIKVILNADIEENWKVWQDQSSKRTRVDYNNGIVKQFYLQSNDTSDDDDENNNTLKMEIHPVSKDNENVEFTCYEAKEDDDFVDPEDILPNLIGFHLVSKEMKNGVQSSKYTARTAIEGTLLEETLWASYNKSAEAWIPVKYDKTKYNIWRGSMERREIWDFENFDSDFDEDVFSTDQYCNDEKAETINHEMNDELVTKHLIFMNPENEKHVDHVFKAFKTKYERNYADKTEHAMRKAIFHRNMRLIVSTNRKNLGYKLSVNHLSDRTPEEMKRHMGLKKRLPMVEGTVHFPYNESQLLKLSSEIPSEYDLRMLGVISPVRNQANCGSCWSFSATSVAEGALALSNGGHLLRLSIQALLDCSWEFGNTGCNGGYEAESFQWMMKYGLPTEEEYGSYTDQDGFCNIWNMTKTYKIKGYTRVPANNVEALKVALYHHGPVSISLRASTALELYSGGIFYDISCSEETPHHAVTVVGYGEYYGETYLIVQNSWGPEWGIGGYFHMSTNNNNCDVLSDPVYVLY